MLTRGTLPSRPDLLALWGQQLAVPTEEIWRALQQGSPDAVSRLGQLYVPRLDQYLQIGLGVPDMDIRDAIIAETLRALLQLGNTGRCNCVETSLYRRARTGAVRAGFSSDVEPTGPAEPKHFESGIEQLAAHVQSTAIAPEGGDCTQTGDAIAFAARIACVAIDAPVWFAESSFLVRIEHARTIHEAVMGAAASYAPACLTPSEIQLHASEIAQAFDSVWRVLPAPTREARILWGLNVDVPGIAKILDTSVARADSVLLQFLTITTVFNTIIGRAPGFNERDLAMFADIGIHAEPRL